MVFYGRHRHLGTALVIRERTRPNQPRYFPTNGISFNHVNRRYLSSLRRPGLRVHTRLGCQRWRARKKQCPADLHTGEAAAVIEDDALVGHPSSQREVITTDSDHGDDDLFEILERASQARIHLSGGGAVSFSMR